MLRYTTDRARPGLVVLYDIRPGNGAGQFLQPRSTHGMNTLRDNTEDGHSLVHLPFYYIHLRDKQLLFLLSVRQRPCEAVCMTGSSAVRYS